MNIMPNLKTNILGTQIEINFNKNEQDRLHKLIENFKIRLKEFEQNRGKVSDSKIFLLAALKLEDELEELQALMKKITLDKNQYVKQNKINEDLTKEIIILKDKLNENNLKDSQNKNSNQDILDEIEKIESTLEKIELKILSKNEI
tara:strand:+ start:2461 stop:2898 length:438 start_codon:yes stop_codon:yes gene_type:complete